MLGDREYNSKKDIALVTGASRGLGYQVAKLLAKKDMHVIGLARTIGGLEALSDEINKLKGTSTMVPINLTNEEELDKLGQAIFERWRKIDVFIHCASVPAPMSPVVSVSLKDFDQTHGMNCLLYTSPSPRDGLLSRMPSSA